MACKKLLCPVDFSPGSRQAVGVATRIANERDAELVLVHALYVPPVAFAGEYTYPAEVVQELTEDASRQLAAAVAEATARGARRVTSVLRTGLPWHQIVEAARHDPDIELIVIGTHGRTGLARVLLGSVAELVVRHAPCPVLAVRRDSAPAPFAHVLCPVDFSPSSQRAMNLAAELAQPGGAGILLFHVLELPVAYAGELRSPQSYQDLDAGSTAMLERWATTLRSQVQVPVTTRQHIGRAGAQILAVLEDDPTFDLVVMGSHGRAGVARMVLGSVAEKTVRHARCPVLVAHGVDD